MSVPQTNVPPAACTVSRNVGEYKCETLFQKLRDVIVCFNVHKPYLHYIFQFLSPCLEHSNRQVREGAVKLTVGLYNQVHIVLCVHLLFMTHYVYIHVHVTVVEQSTPQSAISTRPTVAVIKSSHFRLLLRICRCRLITLRVKK